MYQNLDFTPPAALKSKHILQIFPNEINLICFLYINHSFVIFKCSHTHKISLYLLWVHLADYVLVSTLQVQNRVRCPPSQNGSREASQPGPLNIAYTHFHPFGCLLKSNQNYGCKMHITHTMSWLFLCVGSFTIQINNVFKKDAVVLSCMSVHLFLCCCMKTLRG